MKVHNLVVTGSLQSGGENITSISSSVASTVTSVSSSVSASISLLSSSMMTSMNNLSSSMVSVMATTGSNIFVGNQTISGSIVPAVNGTYDLGSSTHEFRHLYLSSASLYIDGTKVLGSTTQELQITTDAGQSFKILEAGSDTITLQAADGNITLATSGGGDVILDPTTGVIALKGTTTIYAGNRVLSSDGNAIHFGNSVTMTGSLVVTGFIETQELRTTYISSSILYRSGSTKFGDEVSDTHAFTGSLLVSGSISVPESGLVSGSSQITYSGLNGVPSGIISGSSQLPSGTVSGSAQIDVMSTTNIARLATTGSNTFTGNIGINASSATRMLTLGSSSGNHGYIALYGPGSNEGNIYHTSTYGIYMDTNTNLLPIRIDGSKLVIGVTGDVIAGSSGTPEGKMDIKGGALVVDVSNNGYGGLKIDDDSSGDYNVNFRAGRGGTNDGFIWYLNARPGGGGAFSTGNERMRLTNTGLGVGISSPLGKLHVRSSGITAAAPSNGWPAYNAEADTNSRRIYIDTAGNDNITTASYGATVSIELGGYFDSRAVITTQSAGSGSPSDQGQGRGKDLMIKAGSSDNSNGYKGGRLYLNGGAGYQGGFGANNGDILMQTLNGGGNVGINETTPSKKLTVNFGTGISDGLLVTGSQRQETRFKSSGEHSNVFIDSAHSNIYLPTLGLYRNGTSYGEVKLQRASNSDSIGSYAESEMIIGSTTSVPVSIKTNEVRRIVIASGGAVNVYGSLTTSDNVVARNFNKYIYAFTTNTSYVWADVFVNTLSGFFDDAGLYRGFLRSSNGAHYNGYYFDILVGSKGYGGNSSQYRVQNITPAMSPYVGGCGGSPISAIDNTGFTKVQNPCYEGLELFITRLG